MKFEFNDLNELDQFIGWVFAARPGPALTNTTFQFAADKPKASVPLTGEPITDFGPAEQPDWVRNAQPPEPEADKPKRARRTKAEIEAERSAAAVAQDNTGAVGTAGEQEPVAVETPAQTAIREATERARADIAAKAQVQAEVNATLAATDAAGESLPLADYLAFRVPQLAEVSQVDHLKAGRDFIGKHGVQKYNESFSLAGLSNNVMAYSQADCATHMAALEWLGSTLAA